jgi:enediyne biosynthesis protein E4
MIRRDLSTAALLFAVFAASGCKDEAPPPAPPPTPGAYAAKAAAPTPTETPPELLFEDVAAKSGIDFVHETGAYGEKLLPETMGPGVCLFDYDGDGDDDLYFTNGTYWPGHEKKGPGPTPKLYRNDGAFRFVDVTAEAGLDAPFYGMGATAADVDGDGDQDLFVAGVGGYRLYRNDGGRFVECSAEAGVVPPTWADEDGEEHGCFATSCAWFDADGDRRPDLFVAHYVRWSKKTDVFATIDGKNKSYAEPDKYAGESCRLFRNLGGFRFEDVTAKAGVENPAGKSLGVCVLDFDEDGDMDVAVANDKQPNYLYRNRGDGTFENIAEAAAVAYAADGRVRAGMGVDSGYVNGIEGRCSIAIGNFSAEPVTIYERRTKSAEFFVRTEDVLGVSLATTTWLTFGLLFADVDLDGRDDLVIANGHLEPSIQKVRKEVPYEQPLQYLRNGAAGRFVELTDRLGPDFGRPRVGRALAVSDLDRDGALDFVLTVNGGKPAVLRCVRNDGKALRVRVRGKAPGTDALGAAIKVEIGDRILRRAVRTGSSYLACSEKTATFGLGKAAAADRITVTFPGGAKKTLEGPIGPGTIVVEEE